MKNLFYAFGIFCTLFCSGLFASQCHKCISAELERIFLTPNQIALNERGLFVQIQDQWAPAVALHFEAGRFYVVKNDYEYWCDCVKGHRVPCQLERCPACGGKIIRP